MKKFNLIVKWLSDNVTTFEVTDKFLNLKSKKMKINGPMDNLVTLYQELLRFKLNILYDLSYHL